MPSKSRKRNKGHERKAKKEAIKAQKERDQSYMLWRGLLIGIRPTGIIQCHHGFCGLQSPLVPDGHPDGHPVTTFMNDLFMSMSMRPREQSPYEMLMNLKYSYYNGTHQEVWNNESYRKLAIDILICIGTNLSIDDDVNNALCVAHVIVIIEHYGSLGAEDFVSVYHNRAVSIKSRDLNEDIKSSRRDVLKFYRKRTSCKCLKKMHLEARKQLPKVGQCMNCRVVTERTSLSVCSRCMVNQYCSRECQVANWSVHKHRECDAYVRAYE